MQAEFWHKRWADNQIGFHQRQVNGDLQQYWPSLGLAPGSQVLVPLCGKSLDLAWLAGRAIRCSASSCPSGRWRISSTNSG